jgi:hypothetical protein
MLTQAYLLSWRPCNSTHITYVQSGNKIRVIYPASMYNLQTYMGIYSLHSHWELIKFRNVCCKLFVVNILSNKLWLCKVRVSFDAPTVVGLLAISRIRVDTCTRTSLQSSLFWSSFRVKTNKRSVNTTYILRCQTTQRIWIALKWWSFIADCDMSVTDITLQKIKIS